MWRYQIIPRWIRCRAYVSLETNKGHINKIQCQRPLNNRWALLYKVILFIEFVCSLTTPSSVSTWLQQEIYYRLQSLISSVRMIHFGNGEPPFIQEIEQNVWQYCWRVFSCSLFIFVLLTLTPDLRNKSWSSRLLKIKLQLSLPSDYSYNYSV